ncbi:uncharacterized protein [Dermacentor andersoni]|uniref:uncharacterized protein isoform X2 n=1 Tax=Dermacentor andersoni TaxID=34620 RepID=UPI002415D8E6|nr:uncharacterized protein LOC126522180 isoform X2 [Dermacentor andersoni]
MCAGFERIMEDWESEIVPGQPGYVPRAAPIFKSTIGMSRSERRRHYAELLKQHHLANMLHIQNPRNGDACKDRIVEPNNSRGGGDNTPGVSGQATAASTPQPRPRFGCTTGQRSRSGMATPPGHQVALTPGGLDVTYKFSPNCLLVVEGDGTIYYTSAGGPGQSMLRLQDADRAVSWSSRF